MRSPGQASRTCVANACRRLIVRISHFRPPRLLPTISFAGPAPLSPAMIKRPRLLEARDWPHMLSAPGRKHNERRVTKPESRWSEKAPVNGPKSRVSCSPASGLSRVATSGCGPGRRCVPRPGVPHAMKIIQDSIQYPVTTAVGVILLVLFGGLALSRIPIQLTPTVDKPQIRVTTQWPGALPLEVERQIIQEQEDQLKALEGLESIESTSSAGQGEILMTFKIGTDTGTALLDVSNRLEQVPRYPDDALKPAVRATGADTEFIAFFLMMHIDRDAAQGPVGHERDFVDDVVAPEFERVPGVAAVNAFGGQRHEMQFLADPVKLAARKITISQLANALDRENANVSGGDFDEGKGNYTVRTSAEYTSAGDVESVVVAYRNDVPIFARDLGHARLGFEKKRVQGYFNGQEIFFFSIAKAPNENLMQVMVGSRKPQPA